MIESAGGRGADQRSICDHYGTPLGLAIEKGRTPLGLRLLALGADPDRFREQGMRRATLPPGKATRRCSKRWSPPERISRHVARHERPGPCGAGRAARPDSLAAREGRAARPGRQGALVPRGFRPPARVRDVPIAHRCGRPGDRQAADGCRDARDDPLRRGARGEAGQPSEEGKNPAHVRRDTASRPERLRVLRELGCDLAAADKYGRTILHDTASYSKACWRCRGSWQS